MSDEFQVARPHFPHPIQGHINTARAFRIEIELLLYDLDHLAFTITRYGVAERIRIA